MAVFEVKVKATITETHRVIADNEYEAAERAELMFRNDNAGEMLDARFSIRSADTTHHSPLTTHQ